jgi:hypothetical protein
MLPGATRDARRTERFLDGLVAADERRAAGTPVDVDMDPTVVAAARRLRAGLVRVHPSFRFEEALSARLANNAERMLAGLPVSNTKPAAAPGTLSSLQPPSIPASRDVPDLAARPRRQYIVGGVGVASAAISLGAVFVAWRHSHPTSGRMSRAVRTAHGRSSHSGRRGSGVINEILGVVS